MNHGVANNPNSQFSVTPKHFERISIIGLGLMGTMLSSSFANNGHKVIAVDMDLRKVNSINRNHSPIQDSELEQGIQRARQNRNLVATGDCHHAIIQSDVTLVCVGNETQSDQKMSATMQGICQEIGASLAVKASYHLVLLHCQINPQVCQELALPLLEHWSNKRVGKDFGVCFLPLHVAHKQHFNAASLHQSILQGSIDAKSARFAQRLFATLDIGLQTVGVAPIAKIP